MTDDDKTKQELVQIREEMRTADAAKLKRLHEAYFNTAHNGMQASIEDLPELIKAYIAQDQLKYPAMMDVCDGNIDWAAGKVLGLMLAFAQDGIEVSIGEACDNCEEVAAMLITDLHKRGDYQGKGKFRL